MSWREEIEPDWFHEAPFYLTAIIAHGALLTLNPVIRWGSAERALDKVVPVEFVAEIPLPPVVQPAVQPNRNPGGDGPNAPPKPKPSPKPAAVKSKVNKPGATALKAKATAMPRPIAKPAVDARAVKFAREAQAESKRLRDERDRAARAVVAEKAAAAKAERERRAAVARAEAERRAEAAREVAERRAAALAEQKRLAAEAKAAKAAKRAELSSALATMADPDEVLEAGASPAPSGRNSARKGRPAGARKAAAAAALAESTDPGDAAASGGGDLLDAKPRGGAGPEGGGVSWSVDGPVGNRRILTRVSPTSPDWVATRNLDLIVTIRFHVLPDGGVAPGAVILKTSGFPEIDRLALDALRRWRFQSVAKAATPEVWGRVTFRFTS